MSKFKSKCSKDSIPDLVLLPKISEDSIIDAIKKRYAADNIYTYIGNVLISVNPFRAVDICSEKYIADYQGAARHENPPHIFALAETMYKNMYSLKESQCVIISGESGAGKTECAKMILRYISEVSTTSANTSVDIKSVILESNPVLEAFGNAKTLRNNNSSRFGKYMAIWFDGGAPVGANISNFLLEKSRVVGQIQGERNYHIFYQLIAGADQQAVDELTLYAPEHFGYLNQSGCYTVDGMDDAKEFEATMHALDVIGFTAQEKKDLMRVLAGILHLGNVHFVENGATGSSIHDMQALEVVSGLLGIDSNTLSHILSSRTMQTGVGGRGSVYSVPLNVEQAYSCRDSFAKELYSRTFDWLIQRTNEVMRTKTQIHCVGILDIYGFEIFDQNGFEQLCINYTNEKLQQIFIELTLKSEQEEYVAEGIKWTPIKFFNNKIVCDLIEGKRPPGIISILDDVCNTSHAVSEGLDMKFVQKLDMAIGNHAHLVSRSPFFTIKHYAGDVTYHSEGMTEKNKDIVYRDLKMAGQTAAWPFMNGLFPENLNTDDRKKPPSAGSKIRTQAQELVATLSKCTPHYIRCIKPNETKKAQDFNMDRVRHQVQYLGLLENVRVRRAGFADRQPFARFFNRYKSMCPETQNWRRGDYDGCVAIVNWMQFSPDDYQMGKSKIFIRHPESLFALEERLEKLFHQAAAVIQRSYRRWRARKYFIELRQRAAGLCYQKKERRKASLSRVFTGDYVGYQSNNQLKALIRTSGGKGETFHFADAVTKYDRRFRAQPRVLILTNAALYITALEKSKDKAKKGLFVYVLKRRLPVNQISKVSLSTLADNYIIIHAQGIEHDNVVEAMRKTELASMLNEKFNIQVNFLDSISYSVKGGKMQTVSFVANPAMPRPTLKKGTVSVPPGLPRDSTPSDSAASRGGASARGGHRGPAPSDSAASRGGASARGGHRGPVPAPGRRAAPAVPQKPQVRALYNYAAAQSDELDLTEGELYEIVDDSDPNWFTVASRGQQGLIPANFVERV